MKTVKVEYCSCGFGEAFAQRGRSVPGLADHFREHEYERRMYGLHKQAVMEIMTA